MLLWCIINTCTDSDKERKVVARRRRTGQRIRSSGGQPQHSVVIRSIYFLCVFNSEHTKYQIDPGNGNKTRRSCGEVISFVEEVIDSGPICRPFVIDVIRIELICGVDLLISDTGKPTKRSILISTWQSNYYVTSKSSFWPLIARGRCLINECGGGANNTLFE